MPNLTVKVASAQFQSLSKADAFAGDLEQTLSMAIGVPIASCNVFVIETATGPHTTPIYMELLFRASPERGPENIRSVAEALTGTVRRQFGAEAEVAFRGFPATEESLFAENFEGRRGAVPLNRETAL
jgi:hypothetical protein